MDRAVQDVLEIIRTVEYFRLRVAGRAEGIVARDGRDREDVVAADVVLAPEKIALGDWNAPDKRERLRTERRPEIARTWPTLKRIPKTCGLSVPTRRTGRKNLYSRFGEIVLTSPPSTPPESARPRKRLCPRVGSTDQLSVL